MARQVVALKQRIGTTLFKELLALHFSPPPPQPGDGTDYPLIALLVGEIEGARGEGGVHPEVDAFYGATFFWLGIHGMLANADDGESRDSMLSKLVASAVGGLEVR